VTTETAETTQILPADQSAGAPRRWLALPVLLTGAFLAILDFNVVNLALPAIRSDLGASSSEVQFVISAYAATYAVFLITGGRLGDLYGRRRMFLYGVAGFTIASVLCGIAWSPSVLVSGRILQGLTATAMAPQVLASIRVLFPPAEQGRALALYGATFGLANICGQVLGGVLVSAHPLGLAWQAIFLVNVPIGLVAIIGGLIFLSDSRSEAVIGSIEARHAGLASGVMISTFQIGAALGVAIIGGVFFSALGARQDVEAYAHAFTLALGCNVALLALGGVLSLWLPDERKPAA
jgi:predicted MFS family arabinose efflux permease